MSLKDFSRDTTKLFVNMLGESSLISPENMDLFISPIDRANALFDPQQSLNSCSINAQLQILEETLGKDIPEDYLSCYAQQRGYFKLYSGTHPYYIGSLLQELGFEVTVGYGISNDYIKEMLDQGRPVLVNVDNQEYLLDRPQEVPGTNGHTFRVIGYDEDAFIIRDTAPTLGSDTNGITRITDAVLEEARNDYNLQAVFVDPPSGEQLEVIEGELERKILSLGEQDVLNYRLAENQFQAYNAQTYNPYGFNTSTVNYLGEQPEGVDYEELATDVKQDAIEIGMDVANIVATGGYVALMEYYRDKPDAQKKVTRVAVALGALDAFVDASSEGIALDFDLNPLLITSFAYYISQLASSSKNTQVQRISLTFSRVLSKSMKVLEYAGYAALTLEAIEFLTDVGLTDALLEGLETLDFLDILEGAETVGEGVDIFEGLATLGISILASKAVKMFFKWVNEDDIAEIRRLQRKVAPKQLLVKLVEAEAPVPVLLGPYCAVMEEV